MLTNSSILAIDTTSDTVVDDETIFGGQPSSVAVSPIDGRVYVAGRASSDYLHQLGPSPLTPITTLNPLASSNVSMNGPFLSPIYVTGTAIVSSGDTDLDTWGIGPFINLHGGTLNVVNSWTTARAMSILSGGGTVNVQSGPVSVPATRGSGVLTKTGTGVLSIDAPGHTGGTIVTGGALELVDGAPAHSPPITINGGSLRALGSAGSVTVASPSASPARAATCRS